MLSLKKDHRKEIHLKIILGGGIVRPFLEETRGARAQVLEEMGQKVVRRREAEFWGRLLIIRRHFPVVVIAVHVCFFS